MIAVTIGMIAEITVKKDEKCVRMRAGATTSR